MPANKAMLARSGDLKAELVAFAMTSRYQKGVRRFLSRSSGDGPLDEGIQINLIDKFILQESQRDGRSVVDHFIEARPELTESERDLLLGWSDVVEGYFRVERTRGDHIKTVNLLDELSYDVYSNVGPNVFKPISDGMFLHMRVVPVGDVWMTSGTIHMFEERDRSHVLAAASQLAAQAPELVFRNPELLAFAWDMQRSQRDVFIECFGDDMIVGTPSELAARLDTLSDRLREIARETLGADVPTGPSDDGPLWENLFIGADDDDQVALIYDETEGLNVIYTFGLLDTIFAHPDMVSERRYRTEISRLIKDPEDTPLTLRRLVARHPGTADEVIRRSLNLTRFNWEEDSERLLQRYKPDWVDRVHWPTPVPTNLSNI